MFSCPRITTLLSVVCFSIPIHAQQREVAEASVGTGKVSVSYTKADLKGRTAGEITVGMVWRMSAGEAAQLKTDVPVLIGGLVLPPGEHRLSVKRVEKDKWHLLVFRGAVIYADGIPVEETPIAVEETKESVEVLTFKVEAGGKNADGEKGKAGPGEGLITMQWGNHRILIPVHTLTTKKIDWSVGGEPVELEFYGLPRNRQTIQRLRSGAPLRVGLAKIGKTTPVTLHMSGIARGMEVDLVLENASLISAKSAMAANDQMIAMLEGRLETASEQQAERIKARVATLTKGREETAKAAEQAARFAETTTVEGTVEMTKEAASGLLVDAKTDKETITLELRFGERTATVKLNEATFKK